MKIVDLSHEMHSHMPVYPGLESPSFEGAYTLEKNGFREKKIKIYSHTGTHMDAPAHMLKEGATLDQYSIDYFIGKAVVVDLTDIKGESISLQEIKIYEDLIASIDFLVLNTGWHKYWGEDSYFKGFPALTVEAAEWLLNFNLRGIAVDTISIDGIESTSFPIHNMFFKKGLIAIENLTNLDAVGNNIFILNCMPLKLKDADGSPLRAAAMVG